MITTVTASQTRDPAESSNMTTDNYPPTINPAVQRFINLSIEKVIQLYESGHTDQAISQFADILSLYPDNDELLFKLARLYQCAGRAEEAIALLQRISNPSPYYCDALSMLGMILGDRRDFAAGADCLIRLLELDESRIETYNHLAFFLVELNRSEEAYKYLLKSIQIAPDNADTYNYLGNLFLRHWRLTEADEQYRRVVELRPDFASGYANLAWVATLEGRIADAVELYHTALALQPDFRIAADNLLFSLNYTDIYTPEQVRDEHIRLAEQCCPPVMSFAARKHGATDKIRVGYVSPDFKTHSVGFFIEPVLHNHNREHFEIYCYDVVSVPDETTRRMMTLGWEWRTVYGLSDQAIAEQIRADEIDILVDLAGHTKGNRLGVFALSPAPIQVTWLGYPNTTGLKQIDFRLTDELADPAVMTDHLYVERQVRLPRLFLCYAPPPSAPELAPLAAGPIIFCCFNNYPKISDTVLQLWSRVMHALPDSQLCLKNGSLKDNGVRNSLCQRLGTYGIDPSRLILSAFSDSREGHLRLYGACHIALDTYPYNGTTTTCEALLMGVPVVTLAGSTHAARVGMSILTNVGLTELIALTPDQYVDIAINLAINPVRLYNYRRCLRAQLLSSPLTDAPAFTTSLEYVYHWMVQQPGS